MKKLFRSFFKKSSKGFKSIEEQCITTLYDMPVHNWFQLNKGNKFEYLFKKKRQPTEKELPAMYDIYHSLMSEYIDLFGFSPSSLAIFKKKKEIAIHQLDYVITNDKKKLAKLEIAKLQLKTMIESEIDVNLYELKPKVEKLQGRFIDFKKETVVEWFNILKSLND